MTGEDMGAYRYKNICRFCKKVIKHDKVRHHCHLTGNHRCPAHPSCNINVTQKRNNFIPFLFLIFKNYECHLFFRNLVD